MDNSVIRIAAALIIAFITVGSLYFASSVFEPVAFALFAIIIVWPLQKALETRMPRGLALLITVVVTLGVVIKLASMVAWGAGQIAQWVIDNFDRLQNHYVSGTKWLEEHDIFIVSTVAEHFNASSLISVFQEIATRLNSLVGFSLLVFLFMAMGLLETDEFKANLESLGSQTHSARLMAAGVIIGKKFRQYMLVRTLASILTGLLVWVFSLVVGLELAAAWGVIAYALNYIPLIGTLVATVLPTIFAFAQTGSWELPAIVLSTLAIIQFLIGSYFEPLFTAKTLAISPFVVMFAVFFWGFIWGLPGTFIGVPILIAVLTICEQYPSGRWVATLLSGKAPDAKSSGA
ncbi:AI-2E family transporter [Methylocapsa polymorpha]|uniref:AI-2E family transporter n=1 Tax=Methylocapsa polymorpha TaxID=3080828 RepID=A0ABZ0HMZ3_9HYPH|nr:AI-2E family transporter [Methylocapsa sp. RX1]